MAYSAKWVQKLPEVAGPYRRSSPGLQKEEVDTLPKVTLEEAQLDWDLGLSHLVPMG